MVQIYSKTIQYQWSFFCCSNQRLCYLFPAMWHAESQIERALHDKSSFLVTALQAKEIVLPM